MVSVQGGFVEPPPSFSLRSLAESETRLPCHYQVGDGEQVIQVTWTRELSDGTKEKILTAHHNEVHTGMPYNAVLYACISQYMARGMWPSLEENGDLLWRNLVV